MLENTDQWYLVLKEVIPPHSGSMLEICGGF